MTAQPQCTLSQALGHQNTKSTNLILNQFKELNNKMLIYNACIENVELQTLCDTKLVRLVGGGKWLFSVVQPRLQKEIFV